VNPADVAEVSAFIAKEFRDDPARYCRAVLRFTPDEWQEKVLDSIKQHRRVAIRSGHGVGKTRLAASVIHWFIATRANPQIVVTANTQSQLKDKSWRELAKINENAVNKDAFEITATRFSMKGSDTWFASAVPHREEKPEAFAGTHEENVLMVFDEASAIPEIIWETSAGAMTTKGARWLVLGNPTRNTGKFHECFGLNKWQEGDSKDSGKWHTFTVSCLDVPRVDRSYITEIEREYGRTSDPYRVRVLGLPPQQEEQQFISAELYEKALYNKVQTFPHEPKTLGVDVARFGNDRSVLVERKGKEMRLIKMLRGQDTMQIVGQVINAIEQADYEGEPYTFVCVDVIGIGAGVLDRLKEQKIDVIGVNVSEKPRMEDCKNMRAELWKRYKQWLNEGSLTEEFREDTIGIYYSFDSNGKLVMERKEDMKRRGLASPDIADAACMTFYPLLTEKPSQKKKKRRASTGWQKQVGL